MSLTIYTGGAKGVDTHVERLCHLYGHTCVVLIPSCHPGAKSLTPLTQSDLDAATAMVTQVAFRLGRQIHHPISLQYIQRNYHLIQPASLVLALGHFDECHKHLLGGTGWSVVMAQLLGKPLYVFDVDSEQWSWWNSALGQYQPCEGMTEVQIALPTLPRQNCHCRHPRRRPSDLSHPGDFIQKKIKTVIEQITCFNVLMYVDYNKIHR